MKGRKLGWHHYIFCRETLKVRASLTEWRRLDGKTENKAIKGAKQKKNIRSGAKKRLKEREILNMNEVMCRQRTRFI